MKFSSLALGMVLVGGLYLSAAEAPKTNPYKQVLRNVPVLELPAKAAQIIKEAKESQRGTVIVEVIAAISELKPAAVPAVVGTIAQNEPQDAAIAAAAAVEHQPDLAPSVVRAAILAKPSKASTIVIAVCGRAPAQYQRIAIAASDAAPAASAQILNAVAAAIPALKPSIEQAATVNNAATRGVEVSPIILSAAKIAGPTVSLTPDASLKVASASALAESAAALSGTAAGPVIGPPFRNLTRTPDEISPNSTYEVPPTGRDYARP